MSALASAIVGPDQEAVWSGSTGTLHQLIEDVACRTHRQELVARLLESRETSFLDLDELASPDLEDLVEQLGKAAQEYEALDAAGDTRRGWPILTRSAGELSALCRASLVFRKTRIVILGCGDMPLALPIDCVAESLGPSCGDDCTKLLLVRRGSLSLLELTARQTVALYATCTSRILRAYPERGAMVKNSCERMISMLSEAQKYLRDHPDEQYAEFLEGNLCGCFKISVSSA